MSNSNNSLLKIKILGHFIEVKVSIDTLIRKSESLRK